MEESLDFQTLLAAMKGTAAGLRSLTRLQPLEGEGGKLFPATYQGGKYSTEKRRVKDESGTEQTVACALLDSGPSQANRAELALLEQIERGTLALPLIRVDFSHANSGFLTDINPITSFQAPHRLADAILRDSELMDGIRFSRSSYAEKWRRANLDNATAVYEICPTALVFGMWGSPDKPGGMGAKFERSYISEIVAVDVEDEHQEKRLKASIENGQGGRSASLEFTDGKGEKVSKRLGYRIDPLNASSAVMVQPNRVEGSFKVADAKGALKPSAINHGNIPVEDSNTGIRCRYAEQTTVISFGALRKLRFPVDGRRNYERDDLGRTVLAAIGLCAGVLTNERGLSLRSRCSLVPTSPRLWELVDLPGQETRRFTVNGTQAIALLKQAVSAAKAAGLDWLESPIELRPTKELVDLIRESQKRQAEAASEEAGS